MTEKTRWLSDKFWAAVGIWYETGQKAVDKAQTTSIEVPYKPGEVPLQMKNSPQGGVKFDEETKAAIQRDAMKECETRDHNL
jgi:hypothetical protein